MPTDPDADERRVLGDVAGALGVEAGRARHAGAGVEERLGVVGARVPAGAQEEPAALRERPVLRLERTQLVGRDDVVRVGLRLGDTVEDDRGPDEVGRRHAREICLVAAADPVDRRVEMRADVLPDLEPAPLPHRPGVVVVGDVVHFQAGRVRERLGKVDDGRRLAERLGEIDDLDLAAGKSSEQGSDGVGHEHLLFVSGRGTLLRARPRRRWARPWHRSRSGRPRRRRRGVRATPRAGRGRRRRGR